MLLQFNNNIMSSKDRETFVTFLTAHNQSTKYSARDLEEKIYKLCEKQTNVMNTKIENVYKEMVYDLAGIIITDFNTFLIDLNNDNMGFESRIFVEEISKYDNEIKQTVYKKKVNAGPIICNKCKSRRVETRQDQKRSGDEGATNIYTCSNCNNEWMVNN